MSGTGTRSGPAGATAPARRKARRQASGASARRLREEKKTRSRAESARLLACQAAFPSSRFRPPVSIAIRRVFSASGSSRTRSMCSSPLSSAAAVTWM